MPKPRFQELKQPTRAVSWRWENMVNKEATDNKRKADGGIADEEMGDTDRQERERPGDAGTV